MQLSALAGGKHSRVFRLCPEPGRWDRQEPGIRTQQPSPQRSQSDLTGRGHSPTANLRPRPLGPLTNTSTQSGDSEDGVLPDCRGWKEGRVSAAACPGGRPGREGRSGSLLAGRGPGAEGLGRALVPCRQVRHVDVCSEWPALPGLQPLVGLQVPNYGVLCWGQNSRL